MSINDKAIQKGPAADIGQTWSDAAAAKHHIEQFFLGRLNFEKKTTNDYNDQTFRRRPLLWLLERMGNPQNSYPVVHVAGTKGKGSVATMVQQILLATDCHCALYTSPHIVDLRERFNVAGQPVSDAQICVAIDQMQSAVAEVDAKSQAESDFGTLTFFDLCTAAAFMIFRNCGAQFAVVEVGLGGRLDSTNVVQPEVAVITSISFDHMAQLGNTLTAIAGEKAGIIKPGVRVVSGVLNPEARKVILERAAEMGCMVLQLDREVRILPGEGHSDSFKVQVNASEQQIAEEFSALRLVMIGSHQRQNAAVALAVVSVLRQRGWKIGDQAVRDGLAKATLPGRIECVGRDPIVVLDAAHNPASFAALVSTLESCFPDPTAPGSLAETSVTGGLPNAAADQDLGLPGRKKILVFAVSKDKDFENLLRQAVTYFDRIILTCFLNNPRAASILEMQQVLNGVTDRLRPVEIVSQASPSAAFSTAIQGASRQDLVVVAGSVFLLAEIGSLPKA